MKTAAVLLTISVAPLLLCSSCQQTRSASTGFEAKDGWRESFGVDKASLGPNGSNPYFRLQPGLVSSYKSDEGVLTIRVLDQTRVVDGVTTRVIEEREEEGGELKEISRNYFAADRATGDVYYFGEEVDIYKDGAVVGHAGSWMSGVDGARFGLMMPGHPAAGDRFYQEFAPDVAMDRVEIVALDARVKTPAGAFERCVSVRETTPLEKGVGRKWYGQGVGLLKDDEFVLVSGPTDQR